MLLINSVFWQEYSLTISRLVYAAQGFELFSENELYGQIKKKIKNLFELYEYIVDWKVYK